MQRRVFLSAAAAAAAAAIPAAALSRPLPASGPRERLARLERGLGGRIGLCAVDTGSGKRVAWRADERFAMCSTFKFLLAAAVLRRVDAGAERLDRMVRYGPKDLLDYAPTAKAHVSEGGLSVAALCEAAVELSDNTAANLLLASIGGPRAVTALARSLGDPSTRLDRNEPSLNTARPGDARDTTTPAAMAGDLQVVLLGRALKPASRERLTGWMKQTSTGLNRIRAGLPSGWTMADKTGSGERGSTNTIGLVWPPGRPPIAVALYCVGSTRPRAEIEAAHAEVGRLLVSVFS